ncbi:MAG TPA: adenylate/guanylate cyclase domain-containing protein [Pyrinomonadaceae bacterium]|nr:adenylate/guanylate cyclase domain-containing protein [Pyrinomonadaceae bacterium]
MADKQFHYRWEYDLQSSPEKLWPLIADTNRFNRDTGVPSVERAQEDGARLQNARRRLRLFKFGIPVEWEEQPFEWIRPRRFGVVRRYSKGPVAEMRVLAELNPRDDGGTHLSYQVWATPRNALGLAAIPFQIGVLSARAFGKAFRKYDRLVSNEQQPLYLHSSGNFASGGRDRLHALAQKLISEGKPEKSVEALTEMIERADDLSLTRLRPYVLADYWDVPRREMLELCLCATRAGLLNLQWDILCPLCRGGESNASLREIESQAHCPSCNIDFTTNFDRSVELTFRPNPSVRKIDSLQFCVGGPNVTPHIVAQQLLPADSERKLPLALEPGRYRVRTMELPGGQFFQVAEGGHTEVHLTASAEGWSGEEARVAQNATVILENATDHEQLFIMERMTWSDQAATAAEVTALQVFRDLFATEALRPGEMISVGTLTVLFTDLRGSTRLYREIGDAIAFGRVMSHFDLLRETIASEEGALVKTIGDAVMAVFRQPASALRAMLDAQRILASQPDGGLPLQLKAGIHTGPCIAVTLNERLDYFGSTVNMAARLEALSSGCDVIISQAVYDDPEVIKMCSEEGGLLTEPFEMMLKGFDEQQFKLWRIKRRDEG